MMCGLKNAEILRKEDKETRREGGHEATDKGLQRFKEVMGEEALGNLQKLEAISPDFAKLAIDFVYGDLFSRKGISDKTREVAIIGCLVGEGNVGVPLRNHLRGMLNVGWTPAEIVEVLIVLVAYKGFPSSLEALNILSEIVNSQNNEQANYSKITLRTD